MSNGRPQRVTVSAPNPLTTQTLRDQLPKLLDRVSTQNLSEIPARINVLTAHREVLACLVGLGPANNPVTDADIDSLIASRPTPGDADPNDLVYKTTTWMMLDAGFSKEKMQALDRFVTSRSQVYRVQSVGQLDAGGPVARLEAVIDTNNGKPRIVMWRDLTELGRGYE
jgi:hypothetical protein